MTPHEDDNQVSDDVKRKFREALEKKQAKAKQRAEDGEAHLDGHGQVDHAAGSADTSREFRRKSG